MEQESQQITDFWDYLSYAYRSYENYAEIVSVNLRLLKRIISKNIWLNYSDLQTI